MKPLSTLRTACVTGRDCQTVTVRRGHLRWLLRAYDLQTEYLSREVAESASMPVDDYPGRPPRSGEAGEVGEEE